MHNAGGSMQTDPIQNLRTYKTFKTCSFLENYLLHIPNVKLRNEFTKLRISSHRLQIETGRFTRPRKTPVNERLCKLCNTVNVEDEEHFILSCPFYSNERASLYTKLNSFSTFNSLSTQEKCHFITSSCLITRETHIGFKPHYSICTLLL